MALFRVPASRCPDPRSYAVLLLTVTSYGIVNNVVFSLLPLIGTQLGLSAPQLTLIGSCAALTVFLVSPWWGRRSDVWGRRRSILLGVGGYCFSALGLLLVFSLGQAGQLSVDALYAAVFSCRMLQAFLIAAMLPAITAYVIDITTPDERAVGLSHTGAAHGLGAIAGPSLVALASWHLLLPLYAAVAVALVIAFLVFRFLTEPVRQVLSSQQQARSLGYLDPRYRHLLVVGVAVYLGMAISTQMMGFYLPTILALPLEDAAMPLGITQACMAAATVFGQLVLVQRLSWAPVRLLKVGVPVMVAGFLLLATATGLMQLCAGALLIGLGLGVSGPGFSAAVSLSVQPGEQGAIAGLLAACPAFGYVLGPFCAGLLYQYHPRLPYLLAVVVLLAVWPLLVRKPVDFTGRNAPMGG